VEDHGLTVEDDAALALISIVDDVQAVRSPHRYRRDAAVLDFLIPIGELVVNENSSALLRYSPISRRIRSACSSMAG
jgi:hypothetical protein